MSSYKIISNTLSMITGPNETGTTPVAVTKPAGWNLTGAQWIAPDPDQSNLTTPQDRPGTCCVGDVGYTTTFTITGDPSTAQVTLNLMADDYVNVVVNGNRVFSATSGAMYAAPTTVTITSSYNSSCSCYTPFKQGSNTIEFDVHNFGGPTGLSVAAATGTADSAGTGAPTLSVFPSNVIGSAVSGTNANDTVIPIFANNSGGGGTLTLKYTPTPTAGCSTMGPSTDFFLFTTANYPIPTNQTAPAFYVGIFGKDPGGSTVQPGIYRFNMRLTSGAQFQDLCVNAVVTAKPTPTFNLSKTGLYFSSPVNGTVADQTIPLFAGGGNVSWTAKVKPLIPLDNFMTVTPTTGTANTSAGTVGSTITVHMNPQSKAGVHYGVITLTPQAPSTLPAQVMEVVYNVFASGTVPNITPSALIFVGSTAQNIPFSEQTFSVQPSGAASQTYTAAVVPISGQAPIISLPSSSGTTNGGPANVKVDIITANLKQGFNLGAVAVQVGNTIQAESVLVVNLPAATVSGSEQPGPSVHRDATGSSCTATEIGLVSTSLPGGFSASVGWPTDVTAIVLDDCGNPISNASVLVNFSDGEASLPLTLVDSTTGTYSGTWNPATTGAITLTALASTPKLSAHTILTGTVVGNTAPRIAPHGVLNNLNPQVGAPLAPGTVASIFGMNLAGGTMPGSPGVSPLQTNFQGITATIGGIDVPLYYVNDSQLNVQIPYELASGATYPVTVSTNNGQSVPDSIVIADAAPGVAVYADGTLIAQHLDFSLVNANSPAAPNETIQMYMVGLGVTTPAVATNQPAPSAEPLARVPNVTVTVNNENANVLYAGLTPGAIGLYQIDFTIPADIQTSTPAVAIKVGSAPANATSVPVVAK